MHAFDYMCHLKRSKHIRQVYFSVIFWLRWLITQVKCPTEHFFMYFCFYVHLCIEFLDINFNVPTILFFWAMNISEPTDCNSIIEMVTAKMKNEKFTSNQIGRWFTATHQLTGQQPTNEWMNKNANFDWMKQFQNAAFCMFRFIKSKSQWNFFPTSERKTCRPIKRDEKATTEFFCRKNNLFPFPSLIFFLVRDFFYFFNSLIFD